MKTALGTALTVALYLLHQDFWLWNRAEPLVFGVLPVGLFYHAAYTVVISLVLIVLVRLLWPSALEADPQDVREA